MSSVITSATLWQACVDVGGTKLAVTLAQGGVLQAHSRQAEPTAKEGARDAVAQQVIRLVVAACASVGIGVEQVAGLGVSSCSPFVMEDGFAALATPNICGGIAGPARGLPNSWTSAALEAPLKARFAQVRVENDAVAALVAEQRWGALQGAQSCAYVTWSTGVGVGLCVDGHVLRGKNGNAGHAGHMFVSSNSDALCGCGNVGDLEALVGGNAMPRRFGREASALMQAAQQGDAMALAQVQQLCQDLGRMLYNLVVTLDLERISIGGSVFWHHQAFLLPLLQQELQGRMPGLTHGVQLVPAGLGLALGDYAALALL
jgi:glucokinase